MESCAGFVLVNSRDGFSVLKNGSCVSDELSLIGFLAALVKQLEVRIAPASTLILKTKFDTPIIRI